MLDVQLLDLNRDLYPLDMPGPGTKKSKSKRGKTNGASRDLSNVDIPTVLDTVLDEIDSTQEWESIVRILCRMFDLPGMLWTGS